MAGSIPSGLTVPTDAANIHTHYVVDALGRTTEEIDPNGNATYTVYDDAANEVRVYPGFVATSSTTGTTTGPIQVSRTYYPAADSGGVFYTETLTTSAAPTVVGGVPVGGETLDSSNIQSLTRNFTNNAGQVLWSDSYASMSGVTFSEGVSSSSGAPVDLGTSATTTPNFYRTIYAYDHEGRPNKTIEPTGTIYRTFYDGLGQVISQWVGTDDTPGKILRGRESLDCKDSRNSLALSHAPSSFF